MKYRLTQYLGFAFGRSQSNPWVVLKENDEQQAPAKEKVPGTLQCSRNCLVLVVFLLITTLSSESRRNQHP
jgi:uncharacterized protein involved in tellurium resistance